MNVGLLKEAFDELHERGRTIIFSTHQMELAEALCESVAIIDRGRVVACGSVRSLKRAAARRMARLSVDHADAAAWLQGLPGLAIVRSGVDYTDVELSDDTDAHDLLQQIVARGAPITHFELREPTLEALFIDLVGHPAEEPAETLAS